MLFSVHHLLGLYTPVKKTTPEHFCLTGYFETDSGEIAELAPSPPVVTSYVPVVQCQNQELGSSTLLLLFPQKQDLAGESALLCLPGSVLTSFQPAWGRGFSL